MRSLLTAGLSLIRMDVWIRLTIQASPAQPSRSVQSSHLLPIVSMEARIIDTLTSLVTSIFSFACGVKQPTIDTTSVHVCCTNGHVIFAIV
jgi:hypothetical protein